MIYMNGFESEPKINIVDFPDCGDWKAKSASAIWGRTANVKLNLLPDSKITLQAENEDQLSFLNEMFFNLDTLKQRQAVLLDDINRRQNEIAAQKAQEEQDAQEKLERENEKKQQDEEYQKRLEHEKMLLDHGAKPEELDTIINGSTSSQSEPSVKSNSADSFPGSSIISANPIPDGFQFVAFTWHQANKVNILNSFGNYDAAMSELTKAMQQTIKKFDADAIFNFRVTSENISAVPGLRVAGCGDVCRRISE